MMLWGKTELINLEPISGAESLLGYVIGILAHKMLGFHSLSSCAVHQHGNTRVEGK